MAAFSLHCPDILPFSHGFPIPIGGLYQYIPTLFVYIPLAFSGVRLSKTVYNIVKQSETELDKSKSSVSLPKTATHHTFRISVKTQKEMQPRLLQRKQILPWSL